MPPELTILMNYAAARQHSLDLYGAMLLDAGKQSSYVGQPRAWRPNGLFSRLIDRVPRQRLWLDLDRYFIAPLEAGALSTRVLHIADNSNAWYAFTARYSKLIITCHDMIPWRCATGRLPGWRPSKPARVFLDLNLRAMARADIIVAVSETTRDDLIEAGMDAARISVIRNCILQDLDSPQSEAVPAPCERERSFFHMGAGKYPKNTEVVVEAFERLAANDPSAGLILVGQHAEEHAEKSSARSRIAAYRSLTQGQIKYLYQHCAGVLLPSRYEGFGLPVLEGAYFGCPVIASDGGALKEVAPDGPLKLATPVASLGLASAMQLLLTDPAFRLQEVRRARDNLKKYDRSETLAAYTHLYDRYAA